MEPVERKNSNYKYTNYGLIPDDWQIVNLRELCYFENGDRGINYPAKSDFISWGKLFVNTGHLKKKRVSLSSMDYISDLKYEQLNGGKFKIGDILFCLRGSLGKFALIDADISGAIASSLIIIRSNEKQLSVKFLEFYLESSLCERMIDLLAGGAAQPNLGGSDLGLFKVPLPPTLQEQKAIANALSDVDELIQSLEKLIVKKKAIKVGTMQRLLTPPNKGGQRLPGFEGEWEEKKLGEVISYVKGFAFKSKDYQKFGIRIIRVSDTYADQILDDSAVYIDETRLKEFSKWRLNERDIILSTVGSKPPMYDSLVGRAIQVPKKNNGALLNQNAVFLRSINSINQDFVFIQLKTARYYKFIEEIYRGNANQASITLEDLFGFILFLPTSIGEQKAIAKILSDMDNEIEMLESKKAKYMQIKEGMMQELLTGKTRLVS